MSERFSLFRAPAYPALERRAREAAELETASLFEADQRRAIDFSREAAGLTVDFSRQRLTRNALADLLSLAFQARLPERIDELLSGAPCNVTEQRPALHTLLRRFDADTAGPRLSEIRGTRERMREWVERLLDGRHRGHGGNAITDVVNIGIGGSDLGPRLVTEALAPLQTHVRCHYVANVDPGDINGTLRNLAPETTFFVVCSKSFRTEETLVNSLAARSWLRAAGIPDQALADHFLAVTANLEAAADFGIPRENCLPMWDWVGGRYSVWSAVGISSAVAVGWKNFEVFLRGAETMDRHFASAPPEDNLPILLSLLEIWNSNLLGAANHVVLPYSHDLRRLPDFLQQLTMESNGKSVSLEGAPLHYNSAPVLWGSAGTIGQHSFHQLLHQGTRLCPVDFILPLTTTGKNTHQHVRLVANCLAQARALMVGRSQAQARDSLLQRGYEPAEATRLAPHLAMPGNRPSTTISMRELSPASLGALLALYEHRTYCSAVLWDINAFDQWGVELGKELGKEIHDALQGGTREQHFDAATERLIAASLALRDTTG